jgi:hypothetical protein
MDGMNLVDAYASLVTAGTGSGTIDIQIHNVTDAQDVLSTKITIDPAAKSANDGVIDTLYDDVDSWDEWRIDVDAVTATTPGQGLIVTLIFRLP